MLCNGLRISCVAAHQEHNLPDSQCASLNAGLAAGCRVSEINEGKLGTAETFLNEAGAGIAGGPPVAAGKTLEALAALCG
jgi:hypothetical protein